LEAFANIKTISYGDFETLEKAGQIELIGKEIDAEYLTAILKTNAEYTGFDKSLAADVKIAYSPLHGAGQTSVLPVLEETGFNVVTVTDEMVPDGNFPALEGGVANPEAESANRGTMALMEEENCDLGIATDPDADRLRVTVRTPEGLKALDGNQSGALATDYLLDKEDGGYIYKTIVTTDLIDALVDKYGATLYGNYLIGYKYIGREMKNNEGTGVRSVIGVEESYGMLVGSSSRDKDAATGALVLAQYAAELKVEGKNLYDRMFELYEEHGVFVSEQVSAAYPGAEGFKTMKATMAKLRSEPLTELGGLKSTKTHDCLKDDTPTADKGDIIILEFEGDFRKRITIRPSGAEPKLKFYGQWHEDADRSKDIHDQYSEVSEQTKKLLETLKTLLLQ
jgi:phosphomannomutase